MQERRKTRAPALLGLGLAGLLAGCFDPIHGITRNASLPYRPELACIEGAICSVPEVRSVRAWSCEGGCPVTLTGLKPPDRLYYFTYDIGVTQPTLLVSIDYAGRVELSQHLISVGHRLPQAQVDAARPVMIRIEKVLEEHCGLGPLEIRESCSGVDCGDDRGALHAPRR